MDLVVFSANLIVDFVVCDVDLGLNLCVCVLGFLFCKFLILGMKLEELSYKSDEMHKY